MTEPAYMTGPEVCALLRIDRCALKRLRFRRPILRVIRGGAGAHGRRYEEWTEFWTAVVTQGGLDVKRSVTLGRSAGGAGGRGGGPGVALPGLRTSPAG